MADTQEYLDSLTARRAAAAGVRSTQFGDQATQFDLEALDREIARVTQALATAAGTSQRVRYGSVDRGFSR